MYTMVVNFLLHDRDRRTVMFCNGAVTRYHLVCHSYDHVTLGWSELMGVESTVDTTAKDRRSKLFVK